jgi:hypothetical protein
MTCCASGRRERRLTPLDAQFWFSRGAPLVFQIFANLFLAEMSEINEL